MGDLRSEEKMSNYPSLREWIRASLISIPVVGLTLFYGVLHLGLKIPVPALLEPFAALSLCQIVFSFPMYWSRKHFVESGGDLRLLYLTVGVYGVIFWVLVVRYGTSLSFFPAGEASYYYLLGIILMPLGATVAYYTSKKHLLRKRS